MNKGLIIDFNKLSFQKLNIPLIKLKIPNLHEISILNFLEKLKLGSERKFQEYFPSYEKNKIEINLEKDLWTLKKRRKIDDTFGPLKFDEEKHLCFASLLSLSLKAYVFDYIEVVKFLCKRNENLTFAVWLEDRLSLLKNNWNWENINHLTNSYSKFFKNQFPKVKILKSSEVLPDGIPRSFAVKKMSSIGINTVQSFLPFHLRNLTFIRVYDVIHFVCMAYLLFRYPAIYLTGINTKHHFQIYRKILNVPISVIFLPLGSEKVIKRLSVS
jgi:hypothetical protein